ncbi:MAG: nucleotide exchange factor GrpE, partial [Alphaproteobacteria bacterium]|nr:nucleotide exchange factor GrpE [Alphaproteobacteria bacterium]
MSNKKEKNNILEEENISYYTDVDVEQNEESEENKDALVLEKLMEENSKLKDDYLRAFAELENTKKRCQQEIEKNNKFAIANFAKNLLGVADNLQRAIEAASKEENNSACESLLKG